MAIKLSVKRTFMKKYDKYIRTLARKHNVDMGVAMDMLVAHARNRDKTFVNKNFYYQFEGSEGLDYDALDADIKVLEENFIIPIAQ